MDGPFPPTMLAEIERILHRIADIPSGLDSYDEVFHSPTFFPLQRRRELETMIRTARSISPKTVCEIGADKGGGLFHWCHSLPTVEKVIGIEIRDTPYAPFFEKAFPHIKFFWGGSSSRDIEVVQGVRRFTRGIDVLFIDGDKTAFEQDFDVYLPMMSRGGIVFMHDVQDEAPGRAFKAVANRGYHHEYIIDVTEVGESLAREGPNLNAHDEWLRHWRGKSCGVGVIYL